MPDERGPTSGEPSRATRKRFWLKAIEATSG